MSVCVLLAGLALATGCGDGVRESVRAGGGNTALAATEEPCTPGLADVRNPPRFEAWPARTAAIRPAALDLSHPRARDYHTALVREMARGPDFAGHYTIAIWGCGSSCQEWAIVDNATGRVHFPDYHGSLGATFLRGGGIYYRRDSRMLIVVGSQGGENGAGEGVHFLQWDGGALSPVRHVSMEELCRLSDPEPSNASPGNI